MSTYEVARCVHLGSLDRIPPREGKTFDLDGELVAVFRTADGGVYATQAECPHRGGPLADGFVGAGRVVCPLHAFAFDLESGAPLGHECTGLRTYDVKVDADGELTLALGGWEAA